MTMTNWLKLIGTSAEPLKDAWLDERDFFRGYATFPRRPGIKPGDGIAYYATGIGSVFAFGSVTTFPYEVEGEHDGYPWRAGVALDTWRTFVHEGIPLDLLSIDGRDLRGSIKQKSHIALSDAEFAAISPALAGTVECVHCHKQHESRSASVAELQGWKVIEKDKSHPPAYMCHDCLQAA
jgi:hypothetical protein